jgi:phthalate 4,5-dioxygenase oxygenase subunit
VRVLGQDLVLFATISCSSAGRWGLLDRDCPHRGADLSFGRHEGDGLRCPFHGWKFDAAGRCLETPAEPAGSKLCDRVKQRSYPVLERSGILFGWFGEPGARRRPSPPSTASPRRPPTPSPSRACGTATGCRPSRSASTRRIPSFLHRFLNDAALDAVGDNAAGRQFRSASAGEFGGERGR